MTRSPRSVSARLLPAILLPLSLLVAFVAWSSHRPPAPLPHPHFPKTLTCSIAKDLTLTVRYQTATFDAKGAEQMAVGKAWHLAGASFATSGPVLVGDQEVAAGTYALSARKTKQGWQLTLHDGQGFSRPGDDAIELATTFVADTLKFEHLNIDVQPAGDKENTRLFLDVRFDDMLARTAIVIPE